MRKPGTRSLLVLAALAVGFAGCAAEPELPPPPKVAPLTAAQEEELSAAALAEYGDYLQEIMPEIELPEVERVRFVDLEESPTVQAKCLTDAGFPATPTDDGGVNFGDIPASQAEAQSIA